MNYTISSNVMQAKRVEASCTTTQVAAIILGGGEGTRLYPLTLSRCKPAISFGAKYRLIDVPISQCIHAHLMHIYVITQFLSSSLHHHIAKTYMESGKSRGKIDLLTAEQRPTERNWYQGTADAVRQNLDYLLESPAEYFLILSGDQIYNMDLRLLIQRAQNMDADVTIAALPVHTQDATRMGVLKMNEDGWMTHFHEKPQAKELLLQLKSACFSPCAGSLPKEHLGSMGIYFFKRSVLVQLLQTHPGTDFGKHIIPAALESYRVGIFPYEGYWEDIGTIASFYHANMGLVGAHPLFRLHHEERPLFSHQDDLAPTIFSNTHIKQSLIADGGHIAAQEIRHSLIGPRSCIGSGTVIADSYLMGNDYYHSCVEDHPRMPHFPHVGENCFIQKAILDKNVVLGKGVKLVNERNISHYDGENIFIRDGIIVVPRGSRLPDGFSL